MSETDDEAGKNASTSASGTGRKLPKAAERALKEAAERRAEYERRVAAMPKELGGPKGEEPVRYGDWEVKGIASDF